MTTPSKSTAKPRVSSKPRVIAKPEVATPVSAKKTSISPAPAKAVQAVKAAKPSKTAAPKTDKKAKPEKVKVVRDSFTIPKTEYAAIAELKKRAMTLGSEAKKSELIRAGLMLLTGASDSAFSKALAQVPTLKTGRPGKN